jgi:TetR/AcrR family transcriptional repressor of lmrAB and yxaGH operons
MARISSAREDILNAAGALFGARGYEGVGVAELLEASKAPRGSLYFHFPDGKEQIGIEVVARTSARITCQFQALGASRVDLDTYVDRVFRETARVAREFKFAISCPIAAIATEVSDRTPALRAAVRAAFETWQIEVASAAEQRGMTRRHAGEFALALVTAMEGALVLSKSLDSDAPHQNAAKMLKTYAASLRTA